jgi:hypothetical protein
MNSWKYLFSSGNVFMEGVAIPLSFEALLLFDDHDHSQNSKSLYKVK